MEYPNTSSSTVAFALHSVCIDPSRFVWYCLYCLLLTDCVPLIYMLSRYLSFSVYFCNAETRNFSFQWYELMSYFAFLTRSRDLIRWSFRSPFFWHWTSCNAAASTEDESTPSIFLSLRAICGSFLCRNEVSCRCAFICLVVLILFYLRYVSLGTNWFCHFDVGIFGWCCFGNNVLCVYTTTFYLFVISTSCSRVSCLFSKRFFLLWNMSRWETVWRYVLSVRNKESASIL